MAELLLELGCEELPATFVRKAMHDLQAAVEDRLTQAGLTFRRTHEPLGTPRRLIVSLDGVPDRQPDQVKEQRGPGLKAAFDADGNPTKALDGFCRAQGCAVSDLRKEGDYVWLTKKIEGRPSREILAEALPEAIRSLSFEKSMRWGSSRMRFARPIRWILSSIGGEVVPFEIEGVASSLQSRGHRFYSPKPFEAKSRSKLLAGLRKRNVEPDPVERERIIREQSAKVASGTPELPDALVEENVFLTEWPTALEGSFLPVYEDLPEPVLVTAMAKHERFFPVRGADGKLLAKFISIRNAGVDDVVREGNEWVLNARFNDALFFFEEDRRRTFDEFLERTTGIVFQEKLGTVRQRADRLARLAAVVATATGGSEEEIEWARQAGLYAKADLSTGLVSELASLQGVIGGEYARRDGLPEPVCDAIAAQYDFAKAFSMEDRTALRLLIADQLDKLAGYLGLGLAPSGSSDPFGLRRAATILIESSWNWPALRELDGLFEAALDGYPELDRKRATELLEDLFRSRYESLLTDTRHDLVEAVLNTDLAAPRRLRFRLSCLERLADDVAFVQTATRPINIVSAAVAKGIEVPTAPSVLALNLARLDSEEGENLWPLVSKEEEPLRKALRAEDADEVARVLKELEGPINTFFDSTMIMVDDEAVRQARLALLGAIGGMLTSVGDWTKIVIAG